MSLSSLLSELSEKFEDLRTDSPEKGVARVVLNRPERRNAFTWQTLDEICAALDISEASDECKVVLLLAAGPVYCAGADLNSFGESPINLGEHPVWDRLDNSRLPVVTGVQGHAVTGGLLLALSCDLIVLADDTQVADSHASLGLVPTGGEAQKFTRRLGLHAARLLMLASTPLTADDLWRLGVAASVVPDHQVQEEALTLARKVAAGSGRSVGLMKRMINRGMSLSYAEALRADHIDAEWGRGNFTPDLERDERIRLQAFPGRRTS